MSRLKKHHLFSRCYKLSDYLEPEKQDTYFGYEFSEELNEFILDTYNEEDLVVNSTSYHQTVSDGILIISVWIDFVKKRDSTDVEQICEAIQHYAG